MGNKNGIPEVQKSQKNNPILLKFNNLKDAVLKKFNAHRKKIHTSFQDLRKKNENHKKEVIQKQNLVKYKANYVQNNSTKTGNYTFKDSARIKKVRKISASLPNIIKANESDIYDDIHFIRQKNIHVIPSNVALKPIQSKIPARLDIIKRDNLPLNVSEGFPYFNEQFKSQFNATNKNWKCQYCNVKNSQLLWCKVCKREDLTEEAVVIKMIHEVKQETPVYLNKKFQATIKHLQKLKKNALFWNYLQENFYSQIIEPQDVIQALNDFNKTDDIVDFLQRNCPLCLSSFPLKRMHNMLYCTCEFCKTCFKKWVEQVISNGSFNNLPICPSCPNEKFSNFNTSLHFLSFQEVVNSDENLKDLFNEKCMTELFQRDANFMWCTNEKCTYGFEISNFPNNKITCPKCQEYSCKKCKNKWHEDDFCDLVNQNGKLNIFQDFTHNRIDCPNCNGIFYLSKGGCLHLTCKKCKFEFCECCKKKFFKSEHNCGVLNCGMLKTFHAHHPEYCIYYLRDKDINELESMIEDFEILRNSIIEICNIVVYDNSFKENKCGKPCYKDTELCKFHYKDHIASLIFKKNREIYMEKMYSN